MAWMLATESALASADAACTEGLLRERIEVMVRTAELRRPCPDMLHTLRTQGSSFTPQFRGRAIRWMLAVITQQIISDKFSPVSHFRLQIKVSDEAVAMAVNALDRCLSLRPGDKPSVKKLVVAAVSIASKWHDVEAISMVGLRVFCTCASRGS